MISFRVDQSSVKHLLAADNADWALLFSADPAYIRAVSLPDYGNKWAMQ